MSDPFDALLEQLVPGAARPVPAAGDQPDFPVALGLEPIDLIGRGGTGWVWRARDPVLGREVAVKIARPEGGEAAREALLEEARLTCRIAHPAVLPVHRIAVAAGLLCVEFQLAPTRTVEALLADARGQEPEGWPLERRLQLLAPVIGAVVAAHAAGIVHGDLHPGNLAIGPGGEPYVVDWTGDSGHGLSGNPGYAAPELLAGAGHGPASDVWALGAIAWELATSRPLRPRRRHEELGDFLARWRDVVPEPPSRVAPVHPAVEAWILSALEEQPEQRPTAAAWGRRLAAILTGRAERAHRDEEARTLLDRARADLDAYRELSARIADEERVAVVLRAKVPGHAPASQKRPAWEAEQRARVLRQARQDAWTRATEVATLAATLASDPGPPSAAGGDDVLAELWWERMREAEGTGDVLTARTAHDRVLRWDRGRYARILEAPSHLSLACGTPEATARVERFVAREQQLVPEVIDRLPLPLERVALSPGSYRVVVEAPGYAPTPYPVLLGRMEHHHGAVRLYTPAEVGEGWAIVPAGSFRMGGDPKARQPLDPCAPFVGDRFLTRTCVTTREWLAFLDALRVDEAARHVPGEAGLFGRSAAYWEHDGARWVLPDGWEPDWPIFAISMDDATRYCAWRSEQEGRPVRLPTEEEWEKAARGVDGRAYPWGDGFDPTFAHMRQSRPGPPRPWRVADYPVDTSVYGCRDMAGGMREWTGSVFAEGQMVLRGGTWGDDADDLRCACRSGVQPSFRYSFVSFRVASELPRPA